MTQNGGGQQRFEDIVLLLPDEEYEYGSRELGRDKEGVGLRGRRSDYEIREHFPDGKVN
jgi:hypothetical protein